MINTIEKIIDEEIPYQYIVVRADLPLDKMLVNIAHAAGEAIIKAPIPKTTRIALLYAISEQELIEYANKATLKEFQVAIVYEPDPPYNGAAMSFGLAPSTRRNQLRKLFYHLNKVDMLVLTKALETMKA